MDPSRECAARELVRVCEKETKQDPSVKGTRSGGAYNTETQKGEGRRRPELKGGARFGGPSNLHFSQPCLLELFIEGTDIAHMHTVGDPKRRERVGYSSHYQRETPGIREQQTLLSVLCVDYHSKAACVCVGVLRLSRVWGDRMPA